MINYTLLSKAVDFYTDKGYQYIEVPWYVSPQVAYATCPLGSVGLRVSEADYLVASGEQGFLQLMLEDKIHAPKKYQCITPCFRGENLYTDFTRPYFMKLELIHIGLNSTYIMMEDAREFFQNSVGRSGIYKVETKDGYDLNGVFPDPQAGVSQMSVELGSYGHRHYRNVSWTYGTGLAEPRFSAFLKRFK